VTTVRTDMRNNMMGSKDSLTMVKLQKEEEAIRNSDLAHKKQNSTSLIFAKIFLRPFLDQLCLLILS